MTLADMAVNGVSVVIPALNEERFIAGALRSLYNGLPNGFKVEFIVVDGGSVDGTLEVLSELLAEGLPIRVLNNPQRITPVALNIGIQQASFDIVLRADAHAVYEPGYIQKSVELLYLGYGDNVGGVVSAEPADTVFSKLLAMVLNSRIGNGGSGYRNAGEGKLVDTVWCGCWYKSTLEDIGMFDINWVNNQDAELNARLIASNFKVYSHPSIRARLLVRPTFSSFVKQYFNYGRGRIKTIFRHPQSISFRQLMPVFAVVGLAVLIFLAPTFAIAALLISTLLTFIGFRSNYDDFPLLPLSIQASAFPLVVAMNISWVFGVFYQALMSVFKES
ncbi:MAG: glycosyltransferase family 2 protein [Acidiferrobacterales bacterium]|nr:glycosyltransferase family 2 protein [Acidiferrobacterales bacterium]